MERRKITKTSSFQSIAVSNSYSEFDFKLYIILTTTDYKIIIVHQLLSKIIIFPRN